MNETKVSHWKEITEIDKSLARTTDKKRKYTNPE